MLNHFRTSPPLQSHNLYIDPASVCGSVCCTKLISDAMFTQERKRDSGDDYKNFCLTCFQKKFTERKVPTEDSLKK